MKHLWNFILRIFGKRSDAPMSIPSTGVCYGCGVNLFDGTNFCCSECADFYHEYMRSYGNQ